MIRKTLVNPSWWSRREYKEHFWQKERMAEKEEIRRELVELIKRTNRSDLKIRVTRPK